MGSFNNYPKFALMKFRVKKIIFNLKKVVNKALLAFTLLSFCSVFSQDEIQNIKVPDSLLDRSYDDLAYWYYEELETGNKDKSFLYGKVYLQKAKKEGNKIKIAEGYHYMSYISNKDISIKYMDSIISITESMNDIEYPALAYLYKGSVYFREREFKRALDNYIKANEFARNNYNSALILRVNLEIGVLKKRIGDYHEAIKIGREGLSYLKKNDLLKKENSMYLNTLFFYQHLFTQ